MERIGGSVYRRMLRTTALNVMNSGWTFTGKAGAHQPDDKSLEAVAGDYAQDCGVNTSHPCTINASRLLQDEGCLRPA